MVYCGESLECGQDREHHDSVLTMNFIQQAGLALIAVVAGGGRMASA